MTEIVSCMSNIASGTDLQVMLVFCGQRCYLEDGDDANSPGKAQSVTVWQLKQVTFKTKMESPNLLKRYLLEANVC